MDIYHNRIILGVSFALSLIMSSCADDPFGKDKIYSNEICFSVTDDTDWSSAAEGSTPQVQSRYAGACALTADTDTMYLIGQECPGIDVTDFSFVRSRGEIANANTLSAFGVYGFLANNNTQYLVNEKISHTSDTWTPASPQYWPVGKSVRFYSYAPYVNEASSKQGITKLPYITDDGEMALDFTVPSKVEDHIDLMSGIPVTASASPCDIRLRHALTAVRFATGRQLPACTVKNITVSGVLCKGTLNLETGLWDTDSVTTATYSMDLNAQLPAGPDGLFTSENIPIVGVEGDNNTMLLMPQELGENATISLTIEWKNPTKPEDKLKDYTFTSSLKGKKWTAGSTVTYRLSANPGIPVLKLEVVDAETGMPLTEITPGWKGGKKNYQVVSVYDPANGDPVVPIPWTASLIAPDGHEITKEEIESETGDYHNIDYYDVAGEGGKEDCRLITILPEPTFVGKQSDATETLRQANQVGTKTEPFSLASLPIHEGDTNPGGKKDYNTSNCYIVNNPGRYCLPLVYGNAIVDGEYRYETHCGDRMEIPNGGLRNFINHRGDNITSAYIYDHAGCTPKGAKLLWTDQINVIRDVRLETVDGKPMLAFDVPATSIRQCNAVVAVTDKDGVVMWSWHIWVTSMKTNSQDEYIPINHTDNTGLHQHYLYHTNIGHIYAGDNVHFVSHELTIKFRQQLPESLAESRINPKEWEVNLLEADEDVSPVDYFLLYQWGRKDPFVPSIEKYYDENHNAIPVGKDIDGIRLTDSDGNVKRLIAEGIKRPMANWISLKNSSNLPNNFSLYGNLWNIQGAGDEHGTEVRKPYKSIYDPSPVGCKLPIGAVLELLVGMPYRWETHYGYSNVPAGVFNINGKDLFIFAAGYRDPSGAYNNSDEGQLSIRQWYIWEGTCNSNKQGLSIHGDNKKAIKTADVFTSSLGVRPMHVEGGYF